MYEEGFTIDMDDGLPYCGHPRAYWKPIADPFFVDTDPPGEFGPRILGHMRICPDCPRVLGTSSNKGAP